MVAYLERVDGEAGESAVMIGDLESEDARLASGHRNHGGPFGIPFESRP